MGLRDPVSSASHLLVAAWACFALAVMLRACGAGPARRAAVGVFGASLVGLYLASGVFHGLPLAQGSDRFRLFQRIDQSAIYLVIAGTNTPLMATFLRSRRRAVFLGGIWAAAGLAIAALWLLPKSNHAVIVAACLGMGWLGMVPLRTYHRAVGGRAMALLWLGCLLYTLGALCELTEWPVLVVAPVRVGFHEMFHLVSAAASAAFFLFVLRHVIPYDPVARSRLRTSPANAIAVPS